jgi:hypothetical protein
MKLNRTELWQLASVLPLAAEGRAPDSILVFRWGVNETSKGNLLFDELAWKQIESAYRQYGNSLGFDGEHETFARDRKQGGVIQSYGWTTSLRTDQEGLWADVQWTDDVVLRSPDGEKILHVTPGGRTLIESKRVRYFSPVLDYQRDTGRIVRLHTFALTIYPATHNQRPLAASAAGEEPDESERLTMEPKVNAVALLMGLKGDADETAVAGAVSAMRNELYAVLHALGVDAGGKALEAVRQLQAGRQDLAALCQALGADSAPKAVEVARLLSGGRQAVLEATGTQDVQAALGAVRAGQVARERLTTVEAENVTLRAANDTLARTQLFAAHPTKWTPALREKYGAESVAFLTKMTEDLPVQATAAPAATPPVAAAASTAAAASATSTTQASAGTMQLGAGSPPAAGHAPLTPEERHYAKQFGLDEAKYAEDLARARGGQQPGFGLH